MKHPTQFVYLDVDAVARFKPNAIVKFLLDRGPFNLNWLMYGPFDFQREDFEQLAQLLGYSVGGFSELSYASDEAVAIAEAEAEDVRFHRERLHKPPESGCSCKRSQIGDERTQKGDG